MKKITRRKFIETSLIGAGALAIAPVWGKGMISIEDKLAFTSATDKTELGRTGIMASALAMGTGMHGWQRSSDHTRMGQKAYSALIHRGIDHGLNFIDMADLYGTHPYTRRALGEVDRDKYVMLSKIWPRPEDWNTPSGAAEEVNRFRQEMGVEQIDICLIHSMLNDQWTEEYKGIRDGLSELKQKGIVRAVGVSCHDHGALKVAAKHPWVDVIFARINNAGVKMDGTVEEISRTLLTARSNGKAVIGMKIFGEGKLTSPEEKDASLKFVLGNNLVDAMTIGMMNPDQVDDSIARIDQALKAI